MWRTPGVQGARSEETEQGKQIKDHKSLLGRGSQGIR